METKTHEIADGIYRLSTWFEEVAPPEGFTFNQFLIMADQPMLFHCGQKGLFPLVSAAVAKIMPVERLRWLSFGHIEADECGAMNQWLAAAPQAQVVFNPLGCEISVGDLADRPPWPMADDEILDLGGKRVRLIATPHVPHNWEAQVMFEEVTETLFCGDLFSHVGNGPPVTQEDLIGPALAAEEMFQASSMGPATAPTIRQLAPLNPKRLAVMHGSSYEGLCADELHRLADAYMWLQRRQED